MEVTLRSLPFDERSNGVEGGNGVFAFKDQSLSEEKGDQTIDPRVDKKKPYEAGQ